MIKTGLGRRIAFLFIRALGQRSLGLGYALVATDFVLASFIPTNGARARRHRLPDRAQPRRRPTTRSRERRARRLGAFLMVLVYQCDVVLCAMFLTGQASNPLIAKFAQTGRGLSSSATPAGCSAASSPASCRSPSCRRCLPDVPAGGDAHAGGHRLAAAELAKMGPHERATSG